MADDFEFQFASLIFIFGSGTSLKEVCPLALVSLVALSQALSFMSSDSILQRRAANANPSAHGKGKQYKLQASSIDASLSRGQRVVAYIYETYPDEASDMIADLRHRFLAAIQAIRTSDSEDHVTVAPQPRDSNDDAIVIEVESSTDGEDNDDQNFFKLPQSFWRRFIVSQNQKFQKWRQTQYYRALRTYLMNTADGEHTRTAMRGMRKPGSCRSSGCARNRVLAKGLGFALLQFFVDEVQTLRSRADSVMLLSKARELRGFLAADGILTDEPLPKLIGVAGKKWFQRWREHYGITMRRIGMKLTVPWKKIKVRVKVLLQNIFRLRALWNLCHPGVPMRFLSLDQKPSWFNNAGHTGAFSKKGGSAPSVRENFQKTRERYTILTTVPSEQDVDPNVPPKVAVLFKGQPDGSIIKELRSHNLPPWMKVQVQELGSYRSSDMVEALDWILPDANESHESIVVLLDWYKGHLTEEVAQKVKSKGHVLIHHGGGTTPFTQINDTHLHARMHAGRIG